MKGSLYGGGQGAEQVVDRGHKSKADGPAIHGPVTAEEAAQKGQKDQNDGQGIEEHQNGKGIVDDSTETQVGNQERTQAEENRPDPVFWPAGEQSGKGFGTAGDEAHGGL